jgi:flavin-dependent dehydrogenase
MSRPPHYDAIVVGARCAGAATAMLLARQGLRTLVLDREWAGRDTLSTHALMRGAVRQLDRWGLLHAVRATGTPPLCGSTFHYGETSQAVDTRGGPLYAPRRTTLDPLLVDAALRAGAEVRYRVAVAGVARDDRGRVIGVTGRDGTVLATATLTVGADGLQSTIADATGARATRRGHAASAFAYRYWTGLPAERYHWYYRPGRTAGLIPSNGGLACVWVGVPSTHFGALRSPDLAAGYQRVLAAAAPELADQVRTATPDGPVRGFPGIPGRMRKPAGPGWALVGDAGYFKDPITAHGITDALRDAELLAHAAAQVHRGESDERAAYSRYRDTRDALSQELFTVTDRIASYGWDLAEVQHLLLELGRAQRAENQMLGALEEERPALVA